VHQEHAAADTEEIRHGEVEGVCHGVDDERRMANQVDHVVGQEQLLDGSGFLQLTGWDQSYEIP